MVCPELCHGSPSSSGAVSCHGLDGLHGLHGRGADSDTDRKRHRPKATQTESDTDRKRQRPKATESESDSGPTATWVGREVMPAVSSRVPRAGTFLRR